MSVQRSAFDTAVEAFESSLSTKRAEAYVARDVLGMGRQEAADYLGRDPSTVDTQVQKARGIVRLPGIEKVEYPTCVGEEERPAAVIWFENGAALRHVWHDDKGQIEEQTYRDGSVHRRYDVGGSRDELAEFALTALQMFLDFRDEPESCRQEWEAVYDVIVGTGV